MNTFKRTKECPTRYWNPLFLNFNYGETEAVMEAVAEPRVLIVDDMTLVREGLQSLLRDHAVEVVGEASDAQEAVEMTRELTPDVILLDQSIPGPTAPENIALLKRNHAQVEVIVLSETTDEEQAFEALQAGASGYLLKDISVDDLLEAIHDVCNGRTLMHPYITRQLVERYRTLMRERSHSPKQRTAV